MTVKEQFYPATQTRQGDIPLVLLHGWASDSTSWQGLLAELNADRDVWTIDLPNFGDSERLDSVRLGDWLTSLLAVVPARAVLIGWSLGGMLATALADRYPERVDALVTIASNLKFTRSNNWQTAMPIRQERSFYNGFVESPDAALKTFTLLEARGEADERDSVIRLRAMQRVSSRVHEGWQNALRLLATIDNRQAFAELNMAGLHLFGDGDALVPVACTDAVAALNSRQLVTVLTACGHAPHITQPETVLVHIQHFLAQPS